MRADIVHYLEKAVLKFGLARKSQKERQTDTYPLLKKFLTSPLKILPSLLNAPPAVQHTMHLNLYFSNSVQQQMADIKLFSEAGKVSTILSFLTMSDRSIHQPKPIKELLRRLYGMGWVPCMGSSRWRARKARTTRSRRVLLRLQKFVNGRRPTRNRCSEWTFSVQIYKLGIPSTDFTTRYIQKTWTNL